MADTPRQRLRESITRVRTRKASPMELEAVTDLLWLLAIEIDDRVLQGLMETSIDSAIERQVRKETLRSDLR